MKNIVKSFCALVLIGLGTSCTTETCETCTITQVIYEDGVEIGRQTLNSNQQFCGDDLEAVKSQESTVTQQLFGLTQEIVQTVDCQ